jgi:hypothetical protein
VIYADILISWLLAAVLEIYTQHFYTSSSFYATILYMFRIEPSTTVQGAYDVCNKEAVRRINDCYFKLYSDHTAGACNCRGNGLGNPARRWGSDVEKGKYALQKSSVKVYTIRRFSQTSVADLHWFSVSSILGQCGFGSRVLMTKK